MSKTFFLAKSGQTFGPFSEGEIESLRESGQYEKYTWFWDQSKPQWQPIDPPPAAPSMTAQNAAATHSTAESQAPAVETRVAPQPASPLRISDDKMRSISAVCYDQQTVLTGWLAHVTDAGCEFITESHSTAPEFQAKLPILVHLFDQHSGRSMNVSGRTGRAELRGGRWHYRIHWKRCPQLIRESAGVAAEAVAG